MSMQAEQCNSTTIAEFDLGLQIRAVREWLSERRGITSLVAVVRRDERSDVAWERLPDGDPRLGESLSAATRRSVGRLEEHWRRYAGYSPSARVEPFLGLGACVLHGPVDALRRFFDSPAAVDPAGPIEGLLFGDPLGTPESLAAEDALVDVETLRRTMESLGRECYEAGQNGVPFAHCRDILESDAVLAAIGGGGRGFFGFGARPDPLEILASVETPEAYLTQLGIGDAARWGRGAGRGQTVCVIDSGADESHPCLQRQVRHYLRYDLYGHEKEAYACMDHACHGTKIGGWIAGKDARRDELGCEADGLVRLGIAPGAKLFVISALNGDLMRESASFPQLIAALEAAVLRRPALGHSIANISIEVAGDRLQPGVALMFDLLLERLTRSGIVPILAAGNRGARSARLGRTGCYVGAADRRGRAWSKNGPHVDLLAPGVDLLCAHPRSARLNDAYVGIHTGTSIASAIVAGAVALVAAAKDISAGEALARLQATARNRFINIDDALDWT
ncbi:MAG: S8 family serine peptidase [Planctomycetes bacterium]|nr:S8 family serine peptidase [Planctomycetota bacterium]